MLRIYIVLLCCWGSAANAEPLKVCATLPVLGALAQEVGGEDISLTIFAKGTEDVHFVEPRPSFVKRLSQADVLLFNGLELEIGWLPPLIQKARNSRVLQGSAGYVDASSAISPLEVAAQGIDRSMGDLHAGGNPHFLSDPLNGLAVARLIRDRLSTIEPSKSDAFHKRFAEFKLQVESHLVGEKLAGKYDVTKIALLAEHGKLIEFLDSQGEKDWLGGWLHDVQPYRGRNAVADHNLWPYFSRRFGINVVGFMEPKPGVPPTTKHLAWLIEQMKVKQVKVILSSTYYDRAHAKFIERKTHARIATLAHDVGAAAGVDGYISMIDYNVSSWVGR